MLGALKVILLLAYLTYAGCADVITQSSPEVRKPGESLKLSCKISGHSLTDSSSWYGTVWNRHPAGKALEWLSRIDYDAEAFYAQSVQGRFTITKSDSSSTVFLQMNSLKTEDTAVYYCAQYTIATYFDYWGKGTLVTVTSATPSPPTVFPLIASCGLSDATGPLTMGCLATEFLPTPVTFSWTDQSGKAISSDKYRQYPSVQNGGTYTSTSQLSISNAEWEKSEFFTCTVENASGKKHTQVNKPVAENTTPPHVFIIPPSSEELRANKTATIVCVARGFAPKDYKFKWFMDSKEFDASHYINTDAVEDKGYFDASSLLTVKEAEWKGSNMIKCELAHGRVTVSRNISSSAPDCSQCSAMVDVHVEILPPTPEEILTQKGATLTCKATGLASQHNIKMQWSSPTVQELASGTPVVTVVEGHITAVYKYKADLQQWASGNKFICTVIHDESLPSPKSIEYHRVIIKSAQKAPAVFLLSPSPQETTNGQSEVTVTCYVKDFYPEDVYISWLHSDKTVANDQYTSTNLIPKKNENGASSFSVYSKLTMPLQSWSNGDVYTCVVHHETIQTLTKTITRNTDSAGKPTLINVSLTLPDKANQCSY